MKSQNRKSTNWSQSKPLQAGKKVDQSRSQKRQLSAAPQPREAEGAAVSERFRNIEKRKWLHKIQLSVARHRQTCEETWNAESIELAEPLPPLPWLPGLVLSEVRTSITHRTLQGHSERKHRWHKQRQGCQSRLHQGDQAPTLQETSFCQKKMNDPILSQFPILIATLDFGKQINVETFGTIFKMP